MGTTPDKNLLSILRRLVEPPTPLFFCALHFPLHSNTQKVMMKQQKHETNSIRSIFRLLCIHGSYSPFHTSFVFFRTSLSPRSPQKTKKQKKQPLTKSFCGETENNSFLQPLEKFLNEDIERVQRMKLVYKTTKSEYDGAVSQYLSKRGSQAQNKVELAKKKLDILRLQFKVLIQFKRTPFLCTQQKTQYRPPWGVWKRIKSKFYYLYS